MIICTTLLVETSPQAIPLGAACVASAIKHSFTSDMFWSKSATRKKPTVSLLIASAEDSEMIAQNTDGRAQLLAQKILARFKACQEDTVNIVCFSVYMWNHEVLTRTAHILKNTHTLVCIAGGPEVTANPELFTGYSLKARAVGEGSYQSPVFDYVIAGEGEIIVPEVIAKLYKNENIKKQQNTVALDENRKSSILYGRQSDPEHLFSPYLDGTINPADYDGALWELARGCPFKCSYCYESKGGKKVVYFPTERIYKELDLFIEKKIGQVFVLDPTFNSDQKRALDMLRYIKKNAPNIHFYFECRAEFINRSLAKAFSEINCSLQIGLQSADPNVLKLVHRSLDKKKFVRNIAILNEYGVVFGLDLIYGLPADSLKGFCYSIDFALSLYPNHLELFCLSVLPGTDLFDNAESLGLEFLTIPPYHVQNMPRFSKKDLFKAEKLSRACNVFYSKGRAVPWFLTVLKPLKIKASVFFESFGAFLEGQKLQKAQGIQNTAAGADFICDYSQLSHIVIERLQIEFVIKQYHLKKLQHVLPCVQNIISLHGAFSRAVAEQEKTILHLHYHPENLLSPYAQDIHFFVENAKKISCKVAVYMSAQGVDYRML
ncbi:MAG TPA: B12-binding domain-containing radical SAM protein [Treponemataceae bacterium]|nr:B12-binding domain-containing radical SAM protein [Treponemataceae bacterium]